MNSVSIQKHPDTKLIEQNTAYILGAVRDGYLDEKQYLVSIYQKEKKWLEFLKQMVKETVEIDSKIRPFRNAFELRIFSKKFFTHLKSFGIRNSSTMPTTILENKELWIPYVSGFFDAEGYCTSPETFRKTGKKKISFHQNDKASLEFIKSVLEGFGIKTSKIYLQQNRKCHALYIQSSDSIRKFHLIFKPIRKRKQLDNLLSVLPP